MTQLRAACRRCGQTFEKITMHSFDADTVEWFMCATCGHDIDGDHDA